MDNPIYRRVCSRSWLWSVAGRVAVGRLRFFCADERRVSSSLAEGLVGHRRSWVVTTLLTHPALNSAAKH
jgi:hypothetical protein